MALTGDLRTLRALKKALAKLPITASAAIAKRAAPEVSDLARQAFDGGDTVYGASRPRSVDGKPLDLVRTGASRRAMAFASEGSKMRTATLPRYAKYLIGKYDVLPNGPLPALWREQLMAIAAEVLLGELRAVQRESVGK